MSVRNHPIGLLLASICLLAASCATPASAQPTPQLDQRAISEDFVLRFVQIAASLRSVGVVDPTRINEFFARVGSSAYDHRFADDEGEAAPVLWSYFFRNTQVYFGHVRNSTPVAGYYDPLSDFWLITLWDNASSDPVLTASRLVPSEAFGDSEAPLQDSPLPAWMRELEETPLLKALPGRVAQAVRDFESRHPFAARTPGALPDLPDAGSHRVRFRDRLSFLFSTLLGLQADEKVSEIYLNVLRAVEDGDPLALRRLFDGPTDMPVADVVSFPHPLRQELEPVLLLSGEGARIVLSSRIEHGRWYLVSAFDDAESPNLRGIAYVDLFAGTEP